MLNNLSTAASTLEEHKAVDLVVLDLRGLSDATDYFVLASGTSDTHVRALTEHVIEALAGRDRLLCQAWNAVHSIVDAQPVPMDRGRLRQSVLQPDAGLRSLPKPKKRTRHRAAIGPNGGLRHARIKETGQSFSR